MLSNSTERSMPDQSTGRRTSPRREPWTPGVTAALVAGLPIGIVLLSTDGSVIFASDAARPLWAKAHASAAPSVLDAIVANALLAGAVVRDQEITVDSLPANRKGGWRGRQHLVVNATPLCHALHEMDGLLLTLEDVTAAKELAHVRPVIDSLVRL